MCCSVGKSLPSPIGGLENLRQYQEYWCLFKAQAAFHSKLQLEEEVSSSKFVSCYSLGDPGHYNSLLTLTVRLIYLPQFGNLFLVCCVWRMTLNSVLPPPEPTCQGLQWEARLPLPCGAVRYWGCIQVGRALAQQAQSQSPWLTNIHCLALLLSCSDHWVNPCLSQWPCWSTSPWQNTEL